MSIIGSSLVALTAIPLVMVCTRRIAKRSQGQFMAQWAHTGRLNGQIEEMEKTRAWRLHRFVERARGR